MPTETDPELVPKQDDRKRPLKTTHVSCVARRPCNTLVLLHRLSAARERFTWGLDGSCHLIKFCT